MALGRMRRANECPCVPKKILDGYCLCQKSVESLPKPQKRMKETNQGRKQISKKNQNWGSYFGDFGLWGG